MVNEAFHRPFAGLLDLPDAPEELFRDAQGRRRVVDDEAVGVGGYRHRRRGLGVSLFTELLEQKDIADARETLRLRSENE